MIPPRDPRLRLVLRTWPGDLLTEWEERAAILEYYAYLPRISAEQKAYEELRPRLAATSDQTPPRK